MKTGIELIAEERQRQISQEGWTPENDDANNKQEMSYAATAYIIAAQGRENKMKVNAEWLREFYWPSTWSPDWCKPTTSIRDLTKAGALIAAEIDRLQRASEPK